jgi:hypothetical protein
MAACAVMVVAIEPYFVIGLDMANAVSHTR